MGEVAVGPSGSRIEELSVLGTKPLEGSRGRRVGHPGQDKRAKRDDQLVRAHGATSAAAVFRRLGIWDLKVAWVGDVGRPFRCAAPVLAAALVLGNLSVRPAAAVGPRPQQGSPTTSTRSWAAAAPPWRSGFHPAATVPFGMLQLGPDTADDAVHGAVATGSGTPRPTASSGVLPTHLSGAGCRVFGDAPSSPSRAPCPTTSVPRRPSWSARPSARRRALRCRALGNGVHVDLAASSRAGLLRIPYHARRSRSSRPRGAGVSPPTTRSLYGARPGRRVLRQEQPVRRARALPLRPSLPLARRGDGRRLGGLRARAVVRAQVSRSPTVDPTGARRNLDLERPGWSVSQAFAARTDQVWGLSRPDRGERRRPGRAADLPHGALPRTRRPGRRSATRDGRYPGSTAGCTTCPSGRAQLSSISGGTSTAPRSRSSHCCALTWRPRSCAPSTATTVQGGWLPAGRWSPRTPA